MTEQEVLEQLAPSVPEATVQADTVKEEEIAVAVTDALGELQRRPNLFRHKSMVVDLAYAEFCNRRDAGEVIDPVEFCERFPAVRSSLRHRFSVDGWMVARQKQIPQETTIIWPEVGEPLGEYTLLRELGRGTFARVYLATEASTGDRPVVLKLSFEDNAEARTQGRLSHDNIVPVLSARLDESGFTMVCMPYLGSATLHDVLDLAYPHADSRPPRHARVFLDAIRAAVQPDDPVLERGEPATYFHKGSWIEAVARVGERLADALAFVHRQGVRHRDIKPSNILLDTAGRPLLLDFNLSEDERLDGSRVGGTLPYMAPEQLRLFMASRSASEPRPFESEETFSPSRYSESRPLGIREGFSHSRTVPLLNDADTKLDGRADLFSLGVILYELLTGHHPFGPIPLKMDADLMAQLLLERQRAGCTPVRRFNSQVDQRLAKLIESCLAFEVKDRPESAAVFAAALQRQLTPSRRARVLAGAVCVASVLVLAAGGGYVASSSASRNDATLQTPSLSAKEEYANGITAYAEGRYEEADGCFERALTVEEPTVQRLFARGRSRLALGDPQTALANFIGASRLWDRSSNLLGGSACGAMFTHLHDKNLWPKEPHILAAMAYSHLLCDQPRPARYRFMETEQAGFEASKEFWNDRANARIRCALDEEEYKKAAADLNRALLDDPEYLPAIYNRAMLELQWWQSAARKQEESKQLKDPNAAAPLAPQAGSDIDFVVESWKKNGEEFAQLYFDASMIYMFLAKSPQSDEAERSRQYLRQAVLAGMDKSTLLLNNPVREKLLGAEECKVLFDTLPVHKGTLKPVPSLRMSDPIHDWLKGAD